MPYRRLITLSVFCVALAIASSPAGAVLVDVEVRAVVTVVDDVGGVLGGAIVVDDDLVASLTYETSVSDVFDADPTIGLYGQPVPPGAFEVEVAGFTLGTSISTYSLIVYDDSPVFGGHDVLSLLQEAFSYPFPGIAGVTIVSVTINMVDESSTAFSDDGIPAGPPSHLDFPNNRMLSINGCADTGLDGNFCTSEKFRIGAEINFVPEPATGAAAALLGLLVLRGGRERSVRRR